VSDAGRGIGTGGRQLKIALKFTLAAASGCWVVLISVMLLLAATAAHARDDGQAPSTPPRYIALRQTVQAALQAEKNNLSSLEKSLQDHENRSRDLIAELGLKKIQLSTVGSLLLTPETRIDDLEKAWLGIRTTIEKLNESQAELKDLLDTAQKLAEQLTEQKTFAEQQLQILKAAKSPAPETQALMADLDTLIHSQAQRGEILKRLQAGYLDLIARVGETRQGFVDLTEKFSLGIQEKKRSDLFHRTVNPLISLGWKNIGGELKRLGEQLRKTGSLAHWLAMGTDLLASRGLLPVTSLLLYLFSMILILRLRRFCRLLREKPFYTEYPWRRMAIRLLTRSMPLLGTVLVFLHFFSSPKALRHGSGHSGNVFPADRVALHQVGPELHHSAGPAGPPAAADRLGAPPETAATPDSLFCGGLSGTGLAGGIRGGSPDGGPHRFRGRPDCLDLSVPPPIQGASHAGGGPGGLAEAAAPDIFGAGPHHFYHRPGSRTGRLRRAVAVLVHVMGGNGNGPFLGTAFIPDPTGRRPAILQGNTILPGRPLPGRTA
jgi:hypothetical protein